MKATVLDVKNSRIPAILGICATDPRLIQWLNEATERLLYIGKWWGCVAKFNICATDGCLTLPPQISTIEAVNICGSPTPVRDFWWEFLENGAGSLNGDMANCGSGSCMRSAVMRGNYPTFLDIIGVNKKLTLICDVSTDVGKQVLVLGYDQNNNWIRTIQGGSYEDGEVITLAQSSGTQSLNFFSSVTDIQPASNMDGQWWLYEYDTTLLTNRLIGHYQYFETRPSYARYFFPSIRTNSTNGTCNTAKVEIIGKLAFIPVQKDTDYLIIGNIPAMKEMMRAIKLAENETDSVAANKIIASGMSVAIDILDKQLDHHFGSGRRMGMSIVGSGIGSAYPIETLL